MACQIDSDPGKGRCCCNCNSHKKDYHHCTTLVHNKEHGCVCGWEKGWICITDGTRAYSGWSEHGNCELHMFEGEI